jgi:hypothetical protein
MHTFQDITQILWVFTRSQSELIEKQIYKTKNIYIWEYTYSVYLTGSGRDNVFVRIRRFYFQSNPHVDKRVRKFDTLKETREENCHMYMCVSGYTQINSYNRAFRFFQANPSTLV